MAKEKRRILVLCALPYTNAIPHIGNIVGSHLPADIFARYCRMKGYETLFLGGTDENGTPTEIAALELNITPRELTDKLYVVHKQIYDWFNISYDNFSRTSREIHHKTTQEFFTQIYKKGFISEGFIKMPYCENDKLFLPDRYVEGTCPVCGYEYARGDQCEKCATLLDSDQLINPRCKIDGSTPIFKETKHLFLELSKLEGRLERWIKKQSHWRKQVTSLALGWIKEGLKKRSITRDLKWGVKVPLEGYEDKVFYVWFDAPIGYISATKEWATNIGKPQEWKKYWFDEKTLIFNFLGKDNIPFHTIFWPGMLIAHGRYNLPYNVVGYQFCNYEGDKISKSRNWGIFCENLIKSDLKPDIWRYYLTYLLPETKDTEFKWEDFENRINNELVANIGNFIHRTLSFAWNNLDGKITRKKLGKEERGIEERVKRELVKAEELFEEVRLREALSEVLVISAIGNEYFQRNAPWNLIRDNREKCELVIYYSACLCKKVSILLYPFLPESAVKIVSMLGSSYDLKWKELTVPLDSIKIDRPEILFRRIEKSDLERLRQTVTKGSQLKEFFK